MRMLREIKEIDSTGGAQAIFEIMKLEEFIKFYLVFQDREHAECIIT